MELKCCPNPECRKNATRFIALSCGEDESGYIECQLCGTSAAPGKDEADAARLWQALPRASGGLEGAVEVVEERRLLYVRLGREDLEDEYDDLLGELRALPDSGEMERLRAALAEAAASLANISQWVAADLPNYHADLAERIGQDADAAKQALAGPKP